MPNLLFCLTPGTSLHNWQRMGTLERELRLCTDYAASGWNVAVLTFGRDPAEADLLPAGLKLVRFPHVRLLPLLPWWCWRIGRWVDVLKTNQSAMAWHYVRAAQRWHRPILLRCGYVAGRNLELQAGATPAVARYQALEGEAFRGATHVQIATPVLAEWVRQRYQPDPARVSILPNFVDTDTFSPAADVPPVPGTILSIGRMTAVKRFDLLIRTAKAAGARRLTIVGEGPDQPALDALAKTVGLDVRFPGRVEHTELPGLLRTHTVYAQVSSWEGHPKSLVEAMACGCACVITDSTGLREQLEDGCSGWIAPSDETALAATLRQALADPAARQARGAAARALIVRTLKYEAVRDTEEALLRRLAGGRRSGRTR